MMPYKQKGKFNAIVLNAMSFSDICYQIADDCDLNESVWEHWSQKHLKPSSGTRKVNMLESKTPADKQNTCSDSNKHQNPSQNTNLTERHRKSPRGRGSRGNYSSRPTNDRQTAWCHHHKKYGHHTNACQYPPQQQTTSNHNSGYDSNNRNYENSNTGNRGNQSGYRGRGARGQQSQGRGRQSYRGNNSPRGYGNRGNYQYRGRGQSNRGQNQSRYGNNPANHNSGSSNQQAYIIDANTRHNQENTRLHNTTTDDINPQFGSGNENSHAGMGIIRQH